MKTIDEFDRNAFFEVGNNSMIQYTDAERKGLAEIAAELRKISKDAQDRLRKAS